MRKPRSRSLILVAAALVMAAAATWPVLRRGHAEAPAGQYQLNADATVTDTKTGLVWQKTPPTGSMMWDAARAYCQGQTGLPGTGWRMPSMKELLTLIDDTGTGSVKIDATAFPGTVSNPPYWTSSELAGFPTRAWVVTFGVGYFTTDSGKMGAARVRCVR